MSPTAPKTWRHARPTRHRSALTRHRRHDVPFEGARSGGLGGTLPTGGARWLRALSGVRRACPLQHVPFGAPRCGGRDLVACLLVVCHQQVPLGAPRCGGWDLVACLLVVCHQQVPFGASRRRGRDLVACLLDVCRRQVPPAARRGGGCAGRDMVMCALVGCRDVAPGELGGRQCAWRDVVVRLFGVWRREVSLVGETRLGGRCAVRAWWPCALDLRDRSCPAWRARRAAGASNGHRGALTLMFSAVMSRQAGNTRRQVRSGNVRSRRSRHVVHWVARSGAWRARWLRALSGVRRACPLQHVPFGAPRCGGRNLVACLLVVCRQHVPLGAPRCRGRDVVACLLDVLRLHDPLGESQVPNGA